MERIQSGVLSIAIMIIGGLMIIVPQFIANYIPSRLVAESFVYGFAVLAFGVIKFVDGIEGFPRRKD